MLPHRRLIEMAMGRGAAGNRFLAPSNGTAWFVLLISVGFGILNYERRTMNVAFESSRGSTLPLHYSIVISLFLVGCMPSYEVSPTPQYARACPLTTDTVSASLTWYLPVVEQDNRQLEAWCNWVGPAVVDSTPSGKFGDMSERDSLHIVVFNSDAGAGDLIGFIQNELGLVCSYSLSSLGPHASHFVLLLQEALRRSLDIPVATSQWEIPPAVKEEERPGPRLDVVEVARRCGLSIAYAAGARNGHAERDGKREDKGEAILSTLPLSDIIAIELPYEAARRVALGATIHTARGDSLRLVNLHLIVSPLTWRMLQTGNSAHLRQSLAVVDALRQAEVSRGAARGISTVVAGDLNTWSNRETALRHLRKYFPDSPQPLSEPTRGPFPTDHILFRARSGSGDRIVEETYRRIESMYYSDHHPIVAWFRSGGSP